MFGGGREVGDGGGGFNIWGSGEGISWDTTLSASQPLNQVKPLNP